jgi:hypothetical protein
MKISTQNQTSQSIHPALFRLAAGLDKPDFSQVLKPKSFRDTFRNRPDFSTVKWGARKSKGHEY